MPLQVLIWAVLAVAAGLDDFNQLIHPAFSRENGVSQNEFSLGAPRLAGGPAGIALFHEFP